MPPSCCPTTISKSKESLGVLSLRCFDLTWLKFPLILWQFDWESFAWVAAQRNVTLLHHTAGSACLSDSKNSFRYCNKQRLMAEMCEKIWHFCMSDLHHNAVKSQTVHVGVVVHLPTASRLPVGPSKGTMNEESFLNGHFYMYNIFFTTMHIHLYHRPTMWNRALISHPDFLINKVLFDTFYHTHTVC